MEQKYERSILVKEPSHATAVPSPLVRREHNRYIEKRKREDPQKRRTQTFYKTS